MNLTEADIKRIARLARIAVTEQETQTIRGELSNIFQLIETMQAVGKTIASLDTKGGDTATAFSDLKEGLAAPLRGTRSRLAIALEDDPQGDVRGESEAEGHHP